LTLKFVAISRPNELLLAQLVIRVRNEQAIAARAELPKSRAMTALLKFFSGAQQNRTKRCYQCKGHFGLIRRTFAQKQFCSNRCLENYQADTRREISRMKEWKNFLD